MSKLINYVRQLRWTIVSAYFGLPLIAYQGYRFAAKRKFIKIESQNSNDNSVVATKLEVSLIKFLPLRTFSKVWGLVSSISLPVIMREPLFGLYSSMFGCDLEEAEIDDLKSYRSLSDFFCRSIKSNLRPIASGDVVTSPCDGTVVVFGVVENELMEKIKKVNYSLSSFFGPLNWSTFKSNNTNQIADNLLTKSENRLYHCVIYLAPGDYHRFHSPVDWTIRFRRHFSGTLLSVSPSFLSRINGLFHINERVLYVGEWIYGFFSLTAIGATNVGSIKAYFDKSLRTNKSFAKKYRFDDKNFEDQVNFVKGDPFGEFCFGSCIVIIFEAPKDFTFNIEMGQKIKYGQLLSSNCICQTNTQN